MSAEEVFGVGFIFILMFFGFFAIMGLVVYIMNSMGLYTIAKNRGYDKAILAWIPIANVFLIGAIADNINACYNKTTKNRVWMLVMQIVIILIGTISSILSPVMSMASDIDDLIMAIVGGSLFLLFVQSVCSIIFFIMRLMVLYKIYQDLSPSSGVLWLLLTFFFQLEWVAVFALRNNPSSSIEYFNNNIRKQQEYQQNANTSQAIQNAANVIQQVAQPIQQPMQQVAQPVQQAQQPVQQAQQPVQQAQQPVQQEQQPVQQAQQPVQQAQQPVQQAQQPVQQAQQPVQQAQQPIQQETPDV